MFAEYITAALSKANYRILDNGEYVATVPGLQGVWATGKTIEGARTELVEVIEGWIALRLRLGLPIPSMDNQADQELLLPYDLEEPEDITNSLMMLSDLSLHDFLASEPDIYTVDDLKVRYRRKEISSSFPLQDRSRAVSGIN
jgi:predicted RNase H-like HicB family nuclease